MKHRSADDATSAIQRAAIAETRAQLAWEATRDQPFTVQAAAFDRLRAAYEHRFALCRRAIATTPPPDPEPPVGLFGPSKDD